MYIMITKTESG